MDSLNGESSNINDNFDLDDEWENWLKESNGNNYFNSTRIISKKTADCENSRLSNLSTGNKVQKPDHQLEKNSLDEPKEIGKKATLKESSKIYGPICSKLYISTKTMILHLNQNIDLDTLFWKIPIVPYHMMKNGAIKKAMKANSLDEKEFKKLQENLKQNPTMKCRSLSKNNDTTIRKSKFFNVSKVSEGISKKDLLSRKIKLTSAFYNCFILLMRVLWKGEYKELHVKIFNTGKMEIPGVKDDKFMFYVLDYMIANLLKPFVKGELKYIKTTMHTVLINSNFSCNYKINRDKLFDLLRNKYKIQAIYDPCSYPGIQCKFYYNAKKTIQNGVCDCFKNQGEKAGANDTSNKKKEGDKPIIKLTNRHCTKKGVGSGLNQCREMSFMIFRTGSVLVVGRCDLKILDFVYQFIRNILINDAFTIVNGDTFSEKPFKKDKKKGNKVLKKVILVD